MASHQTSSSYLRNSVFDAALEIGLVDPKLSNWLDDVPEVAEDKTINGAQYSVPSSSAGHEPWISSPDSELSHSSTANTLTSITSASSQGSFQQYAAASSRHPPHVHQIPRTVLPEKLELKTTSNNNSNTSVSGTVLHSSPFVLPLQPQKRAPTKLLKKGRSEKKSSREKNQDNSNQAADVATPAYAFLQQEPNAPPSDTEKTESKGFFGRLRDRSRSKSRAVRKGRTSDEERSGKDADASLAGEDKQRRGRDGQQKDVQQRPGAVTVVKVNEGLPQLQLDPLSNRKSADLLSALSAEFSLVAATAAESVATKEAITAYYAGVINPSKPVDQPTSNDAEPSSSQQSQPIPRLKSVMDRPHPKVRTSGFWANKDRGVLVPGGGAGGTGNRRVARKASASRRASVRGAAGVRRVPSHRRKGSALGGNSKAAGPGKRASQLSINGLINAIREEGTGGAETTDFEEVESDSEDDGETSLPWVKKEGGKSTTTSDSEPVPAIPVIVERRPSTKSTRSSKPALSLAFDSLAPAVPFSTPIQRLSPSSPMRSPGSRFRRSSGGSGLPSPLKPPPTSPLPPTPSPDGTLVPPAVERPQSGIVTPTAAKAVLDAMPSPRQSDWFEDEEDSDVDQGRRTPFSRTPDGSRPTTPSAEYIVPTPTSNVTTFQPPPTEFTQPIPRPAVPGRVPSTAEGRARATASAAMSRTVSTLVVPSPNGIPANPRPGTSPQPTGRITPGQIRPRLAGNVAGAPPPSTWTPPTSALTRISSMKSLHGREPQPPPPERSHSRDDSNGSAASGTQRGRTSPFPVRPGTGSRDVSPMPALKRTPSKMSTRQKVQRVPSFHAEIGGDFDTDTYYGRQSEDSVRSGESEGWATTSSARSSGGSGGKKLPREAYLPSPNSMSPPPRRPMHSRGPSPLPPPSASLPMSPSPHHRPGSRMASPPPIVGGPRHPALRPSASFTINRPQQMSASTLAPSPSLRIDRNSRVSARSMYSVTGDMSDDDMKSFKGLDLDEDDDTGKGFDVIAARIGGAPSKSAKLLQNIAFEDAEEDLPPKGRGGGFSRPTAPSLLTVPPRPTMGPNSPGLSPRMRNTPTPTSAGGARWI